MIPTLLRPLAWLFSTVMRSAFAQRVISPRLARAQLWIYHRTGGRFQLSALLVPTLLLISTGARTGQRRETPLMCWPLPDGSFYVAGSNWGKAAHPAWTANLLAHPLVEIVYRRTRWSAEAHPLEGPDRAAAWPVLERQWPHYGEYERQAGRPMRIFRIVPLGPADPGLS